jgi:hypothetical protein
MGGIMNKNEYTLEKTSLQMFKDLYLTKVLTRYGECYCVKSFGIKSVFLNIQDADLIISRLPLQKLNLETLISEYKRLQQMKKKHRMDTQAIILSFGFFGGY